VLVDNTVPSSVTKLVPATEIVVNEVGGAALVTTVSVSEVEVGPDIFGVSEGNEPSSVVPGKLTMISSSGQPSSALRERRCSRRAVR
jgi:hypothetical protein